MSDCCFCCPCQQGAQSRARVLLHAPRMLAMLLSLLLLTRFAAACRAMQNGVMAVAQSRGHAQRARDELDGVLLHDQDLKLGWGKAVTLPSRALNQSSGMSGSAPMASKGDPAQLRPRSVHPAASLSNRVCTLLQSAAV